MRPSNIKKLGPLPDQTLRRVSQFVDRGLIAADLAAALEAVADRYALGLTPALAALIDPSDPNDPIARQFVPQLGELITHRHESSDPIGDHAHMPVKGVVHRYPDRVLLKPVHVCPVYCRFCFRREMVGPGAEALSAEELDRALDYIASHPAIGEVILTGGDPMMLSPRRMAHLIARLSAIPHLQVLRIHSRVPIADPDRINAEMIAALDTPLALWLSIHSNHARELGPDQRQAIRALAKAGIGLLGQTVLLKGVNDQVDILAELFRALISLRVKPYYLHHPDLAPGTASFRLTIEEGQKIVSDLWRAIPGIARPTYVLDIPGGLGKTPLAVSGAEPIGQGRYQVSGLDGRSAIYPPDGDQTV